MKDLRTGTELVQPGKAICSFDPSGIENLTKHHSKRRSPNLVLPHRQGKDLMGAYYLVAKDTDLLVSILSEQGVVGGSSRLRVKTNLFMFFV